MTRVSDAAVLRAQIERPDVDERFLDGDHHQRALNDLRALLVPERDLRRDDLILVDAGDDLAGSEHQLLLRNRKTSNCP